MTPDRLSSHLHLRQYGDFALTDAIRPGPGLPLPPREGYRIEVFRDREAGIRMPMLSAAISAERLFDTFLAVLEPLGEVVHVVLESSHGSGDDEHLDFRRDEIDLPVLASHFCDFEHLLTHDGCTGVAILAAAKSVEVQFDEHKLLHIYATNLKPFQRIMKRHGIHRRRHLPLISETEHFHHTTEELAAEFGQLAMRLGVADFDGALEEMRDRDE